MVKWMVDILIFWWSFILFGIVGVFVVFIHFCKENIYFQLLIYFKIGLVSNMLMIIYTIVLAISDDWSLKPQPILCHNGLICLG